METEFEVAYFQYSILLYIRNPWNAQIIGLNGLRDVDDVNVIDK